MANPTRIITDDEIKRAVLNIIREAKDDIVLVSPYIYFPEDLRTAIQEALKRKTRLTFIYRKFDKSTRKFARVNATEEIRWLQKEGADVYKVSNLHAKIYLNESEALLTSMNLYKSSRPDSPESREVGIRVTPEDAHALRQYVEQLKRAGE